MGRSHQVEFTHAVQPSFNTPALRTTGSHSVVQVLLMEKCPLKWSYRCPGFKAVLEKPLILLQVFSLWRQAPFKIWKIKLGISFSGSILITFTVFCTAVISFPIMRSFFQVGVDRVEMFRLVPCWVILKFFESYMYFEPRTILVIQHSYTRHQCEYQMPTSSI